MIDSDVIHRTAAKAGDLENISGGDISVADVFRSLARHPAQVISRWNWKSALMGAILRASFYLTIYQVSKESWLVTLTAVLVEFSFRFITSGISGALVQSFRRASPAWLAMMIVMISLPIFSHTIEFVTHYAQENLFSSVFAASENKARQKAFAISVLFSVLSALFNLFVMRNGVMLVGAGSETKSLGQDLKRIPLLIIEFIVILPNAILCSMREGKFLIALGFFSAFGLSVGGILGIFRGKWSWAWTTALGAWAVLLFFILLVATVNLFQKSSEEREL
jgi:protein-S-isoprenylcysteine O-methyltransferase Ste14